MPVLTVRITEPAQERLNRLTETLQHHPRLSTRGAVTQAAVIRECLDRGMADLEEEAKELKRRIEA